jgi:hypothetical protein
MEVKINEIMYLMSDKLPNILDGCYNDDHIVCPFNGNQRSYQSVLKYPFNFSYQYRLSNNP